MRENAVPENIFRDINYNHYLVEYEGDIKAEILKLPDYYATVINDRYAIISIKRDLGD